MGKAEHEGSPGVGGIPGDDIDAPVEGVEGVEACHC